MSIVDWNTEGFHDYVICQINSVKCYIGGRKIHFMPLISEMLPHIVSIVFSILGTML